MALRKTTTVEKLETALAALRSRHSTLNERKAEAQSALDQARADQQRFFLESDISDDGAIAKLERVVNAATLRLSSLSDACTALAAQIADAEQKAATEAEREERKLAAKEIMASAGAIQERFESLLRELRSLGESLSAIEHLSFETFKFGNFLRDVAGQIEIASDVMPSQLRGLAGAVERGEAKIPEIAISAAAGSCDDVRSPCSYGST
jgi:chromosome segregation ATPase